MMKDNPDFILEAPNFFSYEECSEYIEYFENMDRLGFASDRVQSHGIMAHYVNDDQIFLHDRSCVQLDQPLTDLFLNRFWSDIYPLYAKQYSVLKDAPSHKIFKLKLQRTEPGGGYHTWHYEAASRLVYDRLLFFILYLNTVEEGGETEFLYYKKRIKAETGKLIVAPCGFTHAHRGNPPLEDTKYILTGWVEYE